MSMMYTKEQQEKALAEFERLGSARATILLLGYPSSSTLYRWYEHEKAGISNKHGTMEQASSEKTHFGNTKEHPRIPSAELKIDTLKRCFEGGEDVEYVSREIGYSRNSIYKWRRQYLKKGAAGLMSSKEQIPREKFTENKNAEATTSSTADMQKQIDDLQLEVDILKETINVLKKDQDADMTAMRNREKAVIADVLKDEYSLPLLLSKLHLAKSSFYYQEKAFQEQDKYVDFRTKISEIFYKNKKCYGYRRIYAALKRAGFTLSEKVVRRLMNEQELTVICSKKKKYSSYKGEITPAVKNIIARNFHADEPNSKWLTDITEFRIPAGKVYLSPIIDCFDGMVVSWTIGTSPNAGLVNSMLDNAVYGLANGEHPVIHSDRGCHYRWPGWIDLVEKAGLIRSMSKKGCSPDNSACEGFFGRLKNEMFYKRSWRNVTIESFIQQVDEYIHWYNEERIKISLGTMSPVEYRLSLGLAA